MRLAAFTAMYFLARPLDQGIQQRVQRLLDSWPHHLFKMPLNAPFSDLHHLPQCRHGLTPPTQLLLPRLAPSSSPQRSRASREHRTNLSGFNPNQMCRRNPTLSLYLVQCHQEPTALIQTQCNQTGPEKPIAASRLEADFPSTLPLDGMLKRKTAGKRHVIFDETVLTDTSSN